MALTLTADISATDRLISITGTVPDSITLGYEFRLDDERLTLTGFGTQQVFRSNGTYTDPDRNKWRIRRGVAVSHAAGTTVEGAVDAFVSSADEVPPTPFPATGGPGGASDLEAVLTEGNTTGANTIVMPMGAIDGTVDTLMINGTHGVGYGGLLQLDQGDTNDPGAGGEAFLIGGHAGTGGYGGDVRINGGGGFNGEDSDGGNIRLIPGPGTGSGADGLVFLNLPTADPAVAGALWADSGVVKVSAG